MSSTTFFQSLAITGTLILSIVTGDLIVRASTLPEDFKSSIIMQPAITKVIVEDDVKTALIILNKMHSVMAEDGWELSHIIEYIDDEDFEGFFVTYKRNKQI